MTTTAPEPSTQRELRLTIVVHGRPAPQGSKKYAGHRRNSASGRISAVLVEQVKGVRPWRQQVHAAALSAIRQFDNWRPLDGPLAADMVFTVRAKPASRPVWWPRGTRWFKHLHWRPASAPDLSKLLRSTEDALTTAQAWKDDARVVEYGHLAKYYAGDPSHPDVLPEPGAIIRLYTLPGAAA
ncbi:RusA family crossover junction endodeoxyribonuclease [Streptomyces scabiei]|uniref:RusA family crossover junction endodeoxyribonuclease n=1 Tax=Streptomyces scabiei TaxID=1930 RepID=UPI000765CA76|nr:RusA family crossover junction endodeoxyribonuclease [Streptomyces scabiei]MDX2999473.1 RusA family crossover junction endodeoxyribonuclease [Streptomyces scabiei]MDX3053189.1 RusA family crossover junction endodeoxyribonuclease [Streptomyces scabiei]MDX3179245.1 RusA family crossover junction endodeoxyribonuclease [Streptomyces scabiei]